MIYFLYSLFLAINLVDLFPAFRIMAMAPFLALLLTRYEFARALWLAAGAGIVIDLLSSSLPFGAHALSYTLTIGALYFYRHYFYFDKRLALALMSGLVSLANTLIEMFLFSFFDQGHTMSGLGLACDIIIMPLVDGIYALLLFWAPIEAYQIGKKAWPKLAKRIQIAWQAQKD